MHNTFQYSIDPSGNSLPFVHVVYKFKNGKPHVVELVPHGNSKQDRPYVRTAASTIQDMKKEAIVSKPKQVVETVYCEKGGVLLPHQPSLCLHLYHHQYFQPLCQTSP